MSKKISISKAIGEALHEEMLRDPKVIIMGEDMGKMGTYSVSPLVSRKSLAKIVSLIHLFPNPVSAVWLLAQQCAAFVLW